MASQEPIDRLVQALQKPKELKRLAELRRRLDPADQRLSLSHKKLGSRGKTFRVYVEGGEQGNSFVVKFNPVGKKDPYLDDVYKDYRILTKLRELKIAPEPLFCSSHEEEKVVGTAFIVMSYVEGPTVSAVQDIPQDRVHVIDVYLVIMRKLAEVHVHRLGDTELPVKHHNTQSYWQEVIDEVKGEYRSIVGFWKWWIWPDPESYVFSRISRGGKPISSQRIGVVHGNLDIGNFVFNPEFTEVRAILNWKYEQNGDRLIDVASLLLVFLDIGRYEVSQRLVYNATDQQVSTLVNEYHQHARNGFSKEDLEFAKAVCCLKQICVVKRGMSDDFVGHENEPFPEITTNPDMVVNLLCSRAEKLYRLSSL